ncbi:MAG: DUF2934 domain-containing protein [Candidatus Zixiibacteriota bacterium]
MNKYNPKHNLHTAERQNEDIAELAHSFFETEGRRNGHDVEHWLRAEYQLINGGLTEIKARQRATRKHTGQ